jgi:hypothetical protein
MIGYLKIPAAGPVATPPSIIHRVEFTFLDSAEGAADPQIRMLTGIPQRHACMKASNWRLSPVGR